MYQAVNHFSNLGPLHKLIISLNKTKVMFSVAPGKPGKQPSIPISGLELKAASDSPALCNDRSRALLFCWFFEQPAVVELITAKGRTTCINKANLFWGNWQDPWRWSIWLQMKCQLARRSLHPVCPVHVRFISPSWPPGRKLILLRTEHQTVLVILSGNGATCQPWTGRLTSVFSSWI